MTGWQGYIEPNKKNLFIKYKNPYLSCKSCLNKCDLKKQTQFTRAAYCVLRTAKGVPRTAKGNLKKQSQFASRQNGVKSYWKGIYGDNSPCGARKNKANQSQFQGWVLAGIIAGRRLFELPFSAGPAWRRPVFPGVFCQTGRGSARRKWRRFLRRLSR